jgi:DNA polymerase-3 subunit alpha
LFGDTSDHVSAEAPLTRALPNVAAWTDAERLAREKQILGFYISGHPLEPYRTEVELFATHTVSQLGVWAQDSMAVGVVITAVKRQVSKRSGAEFARLVVEDFSGSAEVLVFPEAWGLIADRVKTDVPVLLKGGYSRRDQGAETPTFIVESVTPFAELRATGSVAVQIELIAGASLGAGLLEDVREVAERHMGIAPLEVSWRDGNGSLARLRSRSLKLAVSNASLSALRSLLGPERVRLVRGS